MMNRLAFLVMPAACLVLAAAAACAGRGDPALADLDDRKIRASDYLDQLRKITPDQRPDLSAFEAKAGLLRSILQKEIMLAEARARGLDKDRQHLMSDEDIMIMTVQPALQAHLRSQRPEPPPAEIDALAEGLAYRYRLRAIFGPDPAEVARERERLQAGAAWEAVEADWLRRKEQYYGGGEAGLASLDGMMPEMRDAVSALEPGGHTPVIEQKELFHIYHLAAREPAGEEATLEWRRERAAQVWQRDWEQKAYAQFIEEGRAAVGYDVNEEFLAQLPGRFRAEAREGIQPGSVVDLWPTFSEAELNTPVASWEGHSFTLSEFLARLEGIPDGLRPDLGTEQGLNLMLATFTGNKLLLAAFERKGLKLTPEQAWSVQSSSERRMLRRVRREIVAGAEVSEEEIRAFYDARSSEFTGPQEYKARAIVVPDSAMAQGIYTLLRAGADFAHLAGRRSVHAPSRDQGGDLGWIGPHTYEDLFMPLRQARPNTNMPPVHTPGLGGWTILRLEQFRGRRMLEFAEARDIAHATLLEQAEDRKLTEWLDGEMAKRTKIHEKALRDLAIPPELRPGGAPAPADTAGTAR